MKINLKLLVILQGVALLLLNSGYCIYDISASEQDKQAVIADLEDKPLTTYQNKLLDVAFETATAIPIQPHIKDRSLAQEKVVNVSIELDQPDKALNFINKIDNWRRGAGYANLAIYFAKNDNFLKAEEYLNLAENVADDAEDWRKDNIKVNIAKTYTLMGESNKAEKFESNFSGLETGKVEDVKAVITDEDDFDSQVNKLDDLITQDNFDITKNALMAYVNLFNTFFEDKEKRSIVEKKIKTFWNKMPIFVRFELLSNMTMFSIKHENKDKALELINEVQVYVDNYEWPLEYQMKLNAKLVEFNFLTGDKKKARNKADSILALFESKGEKIVNIYRAEALCPLAEVYQTMGDTKSALNVYKKAVAEGIINPNSRPRAEALSATCLSMALNSVEPDDKLWSQINKIKNELGTPW